jgi:hypothetical protein
MADISATARAFPTTNRVGGIEYGAYTEENMTALVNAIIGQQNCVISGFTVPATSETLALSVAPGVAIISGYTVTMPEATDVVCAPNVTNYIWLRLARDEQQLVVGIVLTVNISSTPPADSVLLATAATDADSVTVTTDLRPLGLLAHRLDGYHASAAVAPNTIPVRGQDGVVPGVAEDAAKLGGFQAAYYKRITGGSFSTSGWIKYLVLEPSQLLCWSKTEPGASRWIAIGRTSSDILYFATTLNDDGSSPAVYPVTIDMANAEMKIDGSKVWHQGNDGVGSGLDADRLDGKHWMTVAEGYVDLAPYQQDGHQTAIALRSGGHHFFIMHYYTPPSIPSGDKWISGQLRYGTTDYLDLTNNDSNNSRRVYYSVISWE